MDVSGILMLGNLPLEAHSNRMNVSMNASMNPPYHHDDNDAGQFNDPPEDYAMQMSPSPAPIADRVPFSAMKSYEGGNADDDNFIQSNLSSRPEGIAIPRSKKTRPVRPLLDPHAETKDSRPVKKGVCYHVPKKLQNAANTAEASADSFRLDFQAYVKEQAGSRLRHGAWDLDSWLAADQKLPMLPMTGFLIPSFAKLSKRNRPPRIREEYDQDNEFGDFIYRDAIDDHEFSSAINRSRLRSPAAAKASSSSAPIAAGDDQGDAQGYWDDQPYDNMDQDIFQSAGDDALPNDHPVNDAENMDMLVADDEDDEAMLARRVDKILNEELNSSLTSSYKMICDKMILDFKRGVERYAKETNLSLRVADWTNRIEPLLFEQERMPAFDIHDYSDRILVQVNRLVHTRQRQRKAEDCAKDVVRFNDVVISKEHSSAEVCRTFLACLQLANMGNLRILPPQTSTVTTAATNATAKGMKSSHAAAVALVTGSHDRSFSIQLLDTTKKIDIENYVMPSMVA
jgi:hypothetical protein